MSFAFAATGADSLFVPFNSAQIAATEEILDLWSDVANISFVRSGSSYSNDATVLFSAQSSGTGFAWAYAPGDASSASASGDVFINVMSGNFDDMAPGAYAYMAIIHEIGHAIGLNHPGTYNGAQVASPAYAEDSRQYTVMSYFGSWTTGADHQGLYPVTPLLHDIAALQLLYGIDWTTRTGDTVYGFNSNADRQAFHLTSANDQKIFAIWDAGGTDTLDFSGYGSDQIINLGQEAFSSVGGLTANVSIARGAVIENAIGGSARDTIYGNAAQNALDGGAGDDSLHGQGGRDRLIYSGGLDSFDGGTESDSADFYPMSSGVWADLTLGGAWTIEAGLVLAQGATQLATFASIEDLKGTASQDVLIGNSDDNVFTYTSGFDLVDGGAGSDLLDFSGVVEALYVDLSTNTATARGEHSAPNLITFSSIEGVRGGSSDDILTGTSGADILDGGQGLDELFGGAGDDTYIVDNESDFILEETNGGIDTILTTLATYDLRGTNIENLGFLTATGVIAIGNAVANELLGSDASDQLYGGAGDDMILGQDGADILDGSEGADVMAGGQGGDVYVVDNYGDVIIESAGSAMMKVARQTLSPGAGGFDWIYTGLDYILPENVEALVLTGSRAAAGYGNAANNTLDGVQNPAANRLSGLAGNDRYIAGSNDKVFEKKHGGIDTIVSETSRKLVAHVERLVLTGEADANATGNALANTLRGNGGDNRINGLRGRDNLTGGDGEDSFHFTTSLGKNNVDRITDFEHGEDRIVLKGKIFAEVLGNGKLSQAQFSRGAAAGDEDDRIVFNSKTGALSYDPDGAGGRDAIKFAIVSGAPDLSAHDFWIA